MPILCAARHRSTRWNVPGEMFSWPRGSGAVREDYCPDPGRAIETVLNGQRWARPAPASAAIPHPARDGAPGQPDVPFLRQRTACRVRIFGNSPRGPAVGWPARDEPRRPILIKRITPMFITLEGQRQWENLSILLWRNFCASRAIRC